MAGAIPRDWTCLFCIIYYYPPLHLELFVSCLCVSVANDAFWTRRLNYSIDFIFFSPFFYAELYNAMDAFEKQFEGYVWRLERGRLNVELRGWWAWCMD